MARTPSDYAVTLAELLGLKFPMDTFTVLAGNKFDRIVQKSSIHCFVEKSTGHVYKAASFYQPAKGVRFRNVLEAAEKANRFGAYLYAR